MKIVLLTVLQIFIGMAVFSQHSYEFTYQTSEDEELFEGIQDTEGNFVLCGRIGSYMYQYNPLIVKVSPDGEFITKRFFSSDTLGYFTLATQTPDGNYLFFGRYGLNDWDIYNYLWVVKTDRDLNTIFQKSYYIEDSLYHSCNLDQFCFDSDSNIVVAGIRFMKAASTEFSDLWMIKFNLDGDTLFTKTPQHIMYNQWAQELTLVPSSGEYMVIGGRFDSYTSRVELFRMDSLFNKTGFTNIPKNPPNKYISGPQASSDIWLNDTVFLLSTTANDTVGKRADDSSIGIFAVDTAGTIHNQLILGKPDTTDYAAHYNSMATVNDTTIYIGGYVSYLSFFPEQPSVIELNLIDTDLNLLGYQQFGGDAMYRLNGVIPSFDGGCLMYATRYDYQVNSYERDVHIIKMQREDMELITKVSNYEGVSVTGNAFPNPAWNLINILIYGKLQQPTRIVLFAVDGRKVLDKQIEESGNLITINICSLPEGLYIYSVRHNDQVTQTGMFLKRLN
ncbi:MAG: T9SS type A sorting domain-containing protein [Bacteroidales bacterium]|nr:T9SS type A sorting domain-containing protein [Bacteroidales bacterium]